MKVIVLVAKSSAGKDKILNTVVKLNPKVKTIVSYTSRPIRQGEINGVTYHYISDEQVNKMLDTNAFVEHRIYETVKGKWIYGVGKDSFDLNSNDTYIVILDLQGLEQLKKYLHENGKQDSLTSIYIKANGYTRLLRSLQREGQLNDNQCKEICRRYIVDEEDMKEAEEYCDVTLINETDTHLYSCVEYIKKLTMEE
jgi:guanylate kinase